MPLPHLSRLGRAIPWRRRHTRCCCCSLYMFGYFLICPSVILLAIQYSNIQLRLPPFSFRIVCNSWLSMSVLCTDEYGTWCVRNKFDWWRGGKCINQSKPATIWAKSVSKNIVMEIANLIREITIDCGVLRVFEPFGDLCLVSNLMIH